MPEITLAGESGLRLKFDEPPSPTLTTTLLAIAEALSTRVPAHSISTVPGYQTLLVHFRPALISRAELQTHLEACLNHSVVERPAADPVVLPVCYDRELAPDLEWVSEHAGLTVEDVISRHSSSVYHAYANGFAPGFCYLGEVDPRLAAPRLNTPRRAVPAGAVGIADRQTAVYPMVSPGGWRIIGRCPIRLFDPAEEPPNRVRVGDRVRFEPIDLATFDAMGGRR